jgi:hypothetical protein
MSFGNGLMIKKMMESAITMFENRLSKSISFVEVNSAKEYSG